MKTRVYRDDLSAAIHELAGDMHRAGLLDKQTMREFDDSCLTPLHAFTPDEIKALREREEVSQTVFSRYLGITKDTISKWERGEKRPTGSSLKLLCLVEAKGLAAIA